ncbi:MAG: hypothetical protein ACOYL5_12665 [Phototrophicaceae bacterium]|jgi:hypothetical protein
MSETPSQTLSLTFIRQEDLPADVESFIAQHPELIAYLNTAYTHIKATFGQDVQLSLRLYTDPEIMNYIHLVCYVGKPHLGIDEAFKRLHQFQDNWLFNQDSAMAELVNFSLNSNDF